MFHVCSQTDRAQTSDLVAAQVELLCERNRVRWCALLLSICDALIRTATQMAAGARVLARRVRGVGASPPSAIRRARGV